MILSEIKHGTTTEGQDLVALRSECKGPKYLYFLGGVHGDEVEGVYVLKKWMQTWGNYDEKFPCVVIPIFNPDGYRKLTRVNGAGVDLNRNFPTPDWKNSFEDQKNYPGKTPLSEPENKFLIELFEKFPPGLIVSFHSWKPILNVNGDCTDVAQVIHKQNKYPIENDIGYPTPGSLGTYAPLTHQSPVLTYELPTLKKKKTLEAVWRENESGLHQFMISKVWLRFL